MPPGEPVYVEPPPPRPVREAAMLRPLPTPIERQRLETLSEEVGAPPLPTPLPDAGPAFSPQPSFELPAHAAPVPMRDEKSNLSEMALRLEAALRRPIKPVEPVQSPPAPEPGFASAPARLPTPAVLPTSLREVAATPAAPGSPPGFERCCDRAWPNRRAE